MTDRPILFSSPMVRAILEGRKTQTRRILKLRKYDGFFQFGPSETPGYDWAFRRKDHVWEDFRHDELLKLMPIQAGDRLWVRETWRPHGWFTDCTEVFYMANKDQGYTAMSRQIPYGPEGKNGRKFVATDGKWRPSIHMPRWASRITLQVTDVRVERLQDISLTDAIAEGCRPFFDEIDTHTLYGPNGTPHEMSPLKGPVDDFQQLWDSINGPDAWDANPWVAAYSFKPVFQNIDLIGGTA